MVDGWQGCSCLAVLQIPTHFAPFLHIQSPSASLLCLLISLCLFYHVTLSLLLFHHFHVEFSTLEVLNLLSHIRPVLGIEFLPFSITLLLILTCFLLTRFIRLHAEFV